MTCAMFQQLLNDPRPFSETTVAERFAMRRHGLECQECFDAVVAGYRLHLEADPNGARQAAQDARNLHAGHDIPMGEN